jgi:very-short-patch-repair endonuclease
LSTGAPEWAERIVATAGGESVGTPELACDAWAWRQAETWVGRIIGGDDPAALQTQLEAQRSRISRLTTQLASESAWLAVALNLTDPQRAALTAWSQALKKVGKGTGKYAAHWRGEAQRAMQQASSAVPVWIMPTWRVVESFDPATTPPFDVVIVDESSQCDVFATAVLGMARKAVIVGDDKQISPQAVGMDQAVVHDLIQEHISDLPNASLLDATSSLYDIAKRTFPGVIMLKEHFRCVPEIIQFSNDLSYNGEILPLREDVPTDLGAPVQAVYVPDGYRDAGTNTNPPEAEALVDKVVELCSMPAYDGTTMGVITFLAGGQAQLIEGELVRRLGEAQMERRRIRVGDAYNFQGDERDVMFISLVVAGDGRVGAMTKDADKQRMNVAASRARDQMWAFHSIAADALHSDDVRARLIRYCSDPQRAAQEYGELADRCDSDFERAVLKRLLALGYAVDVQHKVGKFRIDLVVKGVRDRLAIECDGDAYHGADKWDDDRRRQEILERLGWKFFRVRGSAYYRNPDAALAPLWHRLDELAIEPPTAGTDSPQRSASAPDATKGSARPASPAPIARTSPPPAAPATRPHLNEALAASSVEPDLDMEANAAPDFERVPPQPDVDTTAADDAGSADGSPTSGDASDAREAAHVVPALSLSTPPASQHSTAPQPMHPRLLAAYLNWTPTRQPDPRTASQRELIDGLIEVVATEGPVLAHRAYRLLVLASGGQRLSKHARSPLNRAANAAIRIGTLIGADPLGVETQIDKVLRLPHQPDVRLRERGDRSLDEVPANEIAELMQEIALQGQSAETIKRAVLDAYDLVRLTTATSAYLDRCLRIAGLP